MSGGFGAMDNAIRVLTGTHDSAERSRMCHEMLDNPGWLRSSGDDALAAFRYLKTYMDRLERQGATWIDGDLLLAYQNLRAAVGLTREEPWPNTSDTRSEE